MWRAFFCGGWNTESGNLGPLSCCQKRKFNDGFVKSETKIQELLWEALASRGLNYALEKINMQLLCRPFALEGRKSFLSTCVGSLIQAIRLLRFFSASRKQSDMHFIEFLHPNLILNSLAHKCLKGVLPTGNPVHYNKTLYYDHNTVTIYVEETF